MGTILDSRFVGKQQLEYAERYLTRDNWDLFQTNADPSTKLLVMAKRLRACGVHKLSEKHYAHATAVVFSNEGIQDNPSIALQHTRSLKQYFVQLEPWAVRTVPMQGPVEYPSDPTQLELTHPLLWEQIVKDGPIVPSRLSEGDAYVLKGNQPSRSTRNGCAQQALMGMHLNQQALCKPLGALQARQELFQRHATFLQDGSVLSFSGIQPSDSRQPLGPPRYRPDTPAIMDESQGSQQRTESPPMHWEDMGMFAKPSAEMAAPALSKPQPDPALALGQQQTEAPPQPGLALVQLPGHVPPRPQPVSSFVDDFMTKAKSTPKPVSKKAAAKLKKVATKKALGLYMHGSLISNMKPKQCIVCCCIV